MRGQVLVSYISLADHNPGRCEFSKVGKHPLRVVFLRRPDKRRLMPCIYSQAVP